MLRERYDMSTACSRVTFVTRDYVHLLGYLVLPRGWEPHSYWRNMDASNRMIEGMSNGDDWTQTP